ncbi:MAG: hypothetical protein F4Y45_15065 [Acidobacteria bacterium]|nr:hypothetical protein [Acidobacteriota bacterium]MYJ02776.1 hypothetical protein [Acidobacteriota bacterium]
MPEWLIPTLVALAVPVVGGLLYLAHWMGKVDEHRGAVTAFMDEIRSKLDGIFDRLPPPRTVESKSPLKVTPFGRELAKALQAGDWAVRTARTLANQVKELTEDYRIDEFAKTYVSQELDEVYKDRVRAVAYDHGIDTDAVLVVLRVLLRDELIAIRQRQQTPTVEEELPF